MPGSKQKRTTAQTPLSTSEFSSHPLPEQQAFHQQLRTLAQSAVRTVIELVMREELDAFIGAAWGECSPKRKGYRNGCAGYMGHPFSKSALERRSCCGQTGSF
jgi:putative transposase